MKKHLRLIAALLCVLILMVTLIFLTRAKKGINVTLDLTEHNLYTLSDATIKTLEKLDSKITIKLYYSRRAFLKGSQGLSFLNQYYLYVKDTMEKYAEVGGEKLTLEVIDPRTFSTEEEEALSYGLKSVADISGGRKPIEDENLYFGLVLKSELGKIKTIEFFSPQRQAYVEYDVTKLLANMVEVDRVKRIGVISSLKVNGGFEQNNPMRGQVAQPIAPWLFSPYLDQFNYVLKALEISNGKVTWDMFDETESTSDDRVDLLLVIHPKDLPEQTLFAIDQYVMHGGRVIIFVDPFCTVDMPPQPTSPYQGQSAKELAMNHNYSSDINELLDGWGVKVPHQRCAVNMSMANRQNVHNKGIVAMLNDLRINENHVNKDHVSVGELSNMLMLIPGYIVPIHGVPGQFIPLITTSEDSMTMKCDGFQGVIMARQNRAKVLASVDNQSPWNVKSANSLVLACLLKGNLQTNYPDGIDIRKNTSHARKSSERRVDTQNHLEAKKVADSGAAVVVIADVDVIADFWFTRMLGGIQTQNDNPRFLVNMVDFLTGSDELITLRSRGHYTRPFDVFEDIKKEEDEKVQSEILAAQQRIAECEAELKAFETLNNQSDEASLRERRNKRMTTSNELKDEIEDTSRSIRKLKRRKFVRIEKVQAKIKWLNMVVAPSVLLLVAILLGGYRVIRKRTFAYKRK